MKALNLHQIDAEVFVARDRIVRIGAAEVAFVKAQAAANSRKRARICTHRTACDPLHEMLIAIKSDSYIRPHKHIGKSESFHVVEGSVDIIVFDDDGTVSEIVELSEPRDAGTFFYRLAEDVYHTLLITSEILVVHEVTNGPFVQDQTVFAAWAPAEDAIDEANAYMRSVSKLVIPRRQAAGKGHS